MTTNPTPSATVRPLALIQLAGAQVAMGQQHGELLRELGGWQAAMDYYPRMIEGLLRGSGASPVERALPVAGRPLLEAALSRMQRRRPDAYLARSRAFSAALGRNPDHARYLQVMDVFQNVVGTIGRLGLGPFADQAACRMPPACSTLAVWGDASADGRLLHARNFDFPGVGIWDRAPALVFCTPEQGLRYGFFTTRGADTPGITAFNEAGICLTVHTRFHEHVRFDGAAIIDLGHDIARRARCLADAVQIANERAVASTWGLLISSASERDAVLIETTSNSVRITCPRTGEPWLACTNHYLNEDLQKKELDLSPGWKMHTGGRLRFLEATAKAGLARGGLDVGACMAMLGSHGDPDLPGRERAAGGVMGQCTGVQSVVVDPERQAIILAVGACPTGRGPWLRVPWRWSDTPGQRTVSAQELRGGALPGQGEGAVTKLQGAQDRDSTGRYSRGTAGAAWASYMEAGRLEAIGAPPAHIAAAVEEAAGIDPDEPTWRLLQAGFHLRAGEPAAALARLERGLEHEHSPFYRGQMLLWAARAAEASGRRSRAMGLRQELLSTRHACLAEHHRAARAEARRPWRAARLRRVVVHVQLADLGR